MRPLLIAALSVSASALEAQGIWDASLRTGPQFYSYEIKAPVNQRVSQIAIPLFIIMPVTSRLSIDVGTAFAAVSMERDAQDSGGNPITVTSELSGLTDTQLRANYTFGQDFVVVTAGINAPTGSSTVEPEELEAAALIGSDFLSKRESRGYPPSASMRSEAW